MAHQPAHSQYAPQGGDGDVIEFLQGLYGMCSTLIDVSLTAGKGKQGSGVITHLLFYLPLMGNCYLSLGMGLIELQIVPQ